MNDIQRQREHFESIAEKYSKSRKDSKHLLVKNAIWRCFFATLPLPEKSTMDVLEAMCGEADGLDIFARNSSARFVYTGFDFSKNMVAMARKKHPEANVFWADATAFSEKSNYDVALIIGGLHHVYQHKEQVVENIHGALRDGGLFINFEPTHNNIVTRKAREVIYEKNSFFDEATERGFSTNELDALMSSKGFEVVSQMYPGLLAYVLWYNPDAFPFLNMGSDIFVRSILKFEEKIWHTPFAKLLSFTTLSCYRKKYAGNATLRSCTEVGHRS